MRLPNDNMTQRPNGYIVEIRNPIRRRTTRHISTPELFMAVSGENPSNIARNGNDDSNSKSSDMRLRWRSMRRNDDGLTWFNSVTRNEHWQERIGGIVMDVFDPGITVRSFGIAFIAATALHLAACVPVPSYPGVYVEEWPSTPRVIPGPTQSHGRYAHHRKKRPA